MFSLPAALLLAGSSGMVTWSRPQLAEQTLPITELSLVPPLQAIIVLGFVLVGTTIVWPHRFKLVNVSDYTAAMFSAEVLFITSIVGIYISMSPDLTQDMPNVLFQGSSILPSLWIGSHVFLTGLPWQSIDLKNESDKKRLIEGFGFATGALFAGVFIQSSIVGNAPASLESASPWIDILRIVLYNVGGATLIIGGVNALLFAPLLVIHMVRDLIYA
jgi:hypothetical protein